MTKTGPGPTSFLREEGRSWRLIKEGARTAAENMAVDEALLNSCASGESPPILRFYRWEPPGLSIGYFQSHEREVNEEGCRQLGFDWVRRPTGGRAVLHQHELTYAVVIDVALMPGSVLETYRGLSSALVAGLKHLGIEAALAPGRPPTRKSRELSSAACFDSATPNEVTVEGKKVIGSAQVRKRGVLLQHGSIPLRIDRDAAVACMNLGSEAVRKRVLRTLASKAAGLEEVAGRTFSPGEVARALQQGFEETLGIVFREEGLSPGEQRQVQRLAVERYRRDEWNMAR